MSNNNEAAADVFRRIATGEDKIVSCEPPWTEAWCENVEIKTQLGYGITIFHRWGNWKYTDQVRDPSGAVLWDFDKMPDGRWHGPEYDLNVAEQEKLFAILNPHDPEHFFQKRETLRATDPVAYHKAEAERLRGFFAGLDDAAQKGHIGRYLDSTARWHEAEARRAKEVS